MADLDPRDKETFEALVKTVQGFYPKYKVINKQSSWLHRFIGALFKGLAINKTYMTNYWTTIGSTVAYPKEGYKGEHYSSWDINVHEGNHAGQSNRWTAFLFGLLYLLGTPVYAVLGLLFSIPFFVVGGVVDSFPLWSGAIPLCLGVLLSIPVPFAWFRYRFELTAYGASVAVGYWCFGPQWMDEKRIELRVATFAGGDYFFMMPIKSVVRKKLLKALELTKNDKFIKEWAPKYSKYYEACYKTLKEQNRVRGV